MTAPTPPRRRELSIDDYVEGVLAGDRSTLGRALTLIESNSARHRERAQELLRRLLPHSGNALRIGITGVPGAGKSTFVDQFGVNLTALGLKVAVLAIDPSSQLTRGSILGDKTRMQQLSVDPRAFVRPSPSSGSLGGVARKTREGMLVCEAAGFDIILVETVGVGQSETVVSDMVDFFLLVQIAGAGDELQGIKRGIMELADLVAVNKAEGDNELPARRAAREIHAAMHYMRPRTPGWTPHVQTMSGLHNLGLDTVWSKIEEYQREMTENGQLQQRRHEQLLRWTWDIVEDHLMSSFREHPEVRAINSALPSQLDAGATTPTLAATEMLRAFGLKV